MMERFNTKEAIVFTTAQMYLKDRMDYLEEIAEKQKRKALKLV